MGIRSIAKPRRTRQGPDQILGLVLAVIAGLLIASGVALVVRDRVTGKAIGPEEQRRLLVQDRLARRAAIDRWRVQEPQLAQALGQGRPELGAVWSTRGGRVCGLVNGWGSFGGLTGMTRFYTEDEGFVFSARTREGFNPIWQDCQADRWQQLHKGTEERGFCGTRLGRKRCAREEGWTRYPATPY